MQGPKRLNVSKPSKNVFHLFITLKGSIFDFCSFDDDVDFFSLFQV